DIKSSVSRIKERSERYGFQRSLNQGSRDYRGSRNNQWHDPRVAALNIVEADVVGFEVPKQRLINWMVKGKEPTVISIVGMGGQGKTTLAKIVFDNKDIIGHFDCHVFITVSQSYTVEGLLRNMLVKLYKENDEVPPPRIFEKYQESMLTDEVKNYLQNKRYVVVFDDVWNEHFWDDVEFALIDNKNGSKILITTRNANVLVSCSKSSFIVKKHELQPLTPKQSRELFNKKAFKINNDSKKLNDIAYEIVEQCNGLPLAIVAIGGLLSTREKNVSEWEQFRDNLSLALRNDTHLIGIKKILGLSYDDLPYYLKACLLYFGLYPKVYEIKSKRVIRQWIAEGFVKEEKGKTLEEVAEGYLIELIHRSLVQVSSVKIDGKVKGCRVHDQIRDMIREKFEDFNFCKPISEDGQSSSVGIIRHLSISTTSVYLMDRIESSHVRSLHVFQDEDEYVCHEPTIPEKFKLLKVLDFESAPMLNVPKNLGDLIHLKYLSFRSSNHVSKSIGMFQNLETLDVGDTTTRELPKEISKLRKLRHLIGYRLSLIQLKDGIGKMTSLQTLCSVDLGKGGAEVIKELGKLKQIRDLVLVNVHTEDVSILSSAIDEMKRIEKLSVSSFDIHTFIDLNLISPPTKLRKLQLHGKLQKLPKSILELQNLVVLKLSKSKLTEDLMESLQSLQHSLLILSIGDDAYQGSHLHFQNGWFQKLKELYVALGLGHGDINIVIDKGALPSLQKLHLEKNIPTGIQHLKKL
ncbi:disease resistance protein rpm1-like, partial [Trifolium pratense]